MKVDASALRRLLRFTGLGVLGLLLASVGYLPAQVTLVSWDVESQNASATPTIQGTLATNVASGALTLGAGISASSAVSTFGGSGFNQLTFANAISNNDYLSFSITPMAGNAVSISSITYLVGKASGSTSFNAILTSDKTGFNASSALDTYSFSSASPAVRSITLSSVSALQNITTATEFRIYGVSSSTDTFRVRSNGGSDLIVSGSVSAIPEPSTYAAIAGLVILGVAVVRKRRSSRTRS